MENQKSAIGLDGNIAAALGYPIGIIALILIIIEKENRFVRFHAIQSLLWSVLMTIVIILVAVVGTILTLILSQASSSLGMIVGMILMLLYLGAFLAWFGGLIFAAIKAYGNDMYKLPVVGNFAEKWTS